MLRRAVGVDQHHRDRLDAALSNPLHRAEDTGLVERSDDFSGSANSFADFEPKSALDEGPRRLIGEVVKMRDVDASQLQDVSEAFGGE
jgi:hypothetical protein